MLQWIYSLKILSQYCAKLTLVIPLWRKAADGSGPRTVVDTLKLNFESLGLISSLYNLSRLLFVPNGFP